jgi:hypothetical protein
VERCYVFARTTSGTLTMFSESVENASVLNTNTEDQSILSQSSALAENMTVVVSSSLDGETSDVERDKRNRQEVCERLATCCLWYCFWTG